MVEPSSPEPDKFREQPAGRRGIYDRNLGGVPVRLIGSGMELACYTLLLGGAGYWIDSTWHTQPYLGIAGSLLGFSLGMYRLIVLATRQQ